MMLKKTKSAFIRFNTWAILFVIVLFGAGAFYSCLKILQEEEEAIFSYKHKHEKIEDLQNVFRKLETQIVTYFDIASGREITYDLNDISNALSEFQDNFVSFNRSSGDMAHGHILQNKELMLLNEIQKHMLGLVPLLREGGIKDDVNKYDEMLFLMAMIQDELEQFGAYQTENEDNLLTEEVMNERRNRIFFSILLLTLSGFILIIFLVYKHDALEAANRDREEILDIANQRIAAIEASSDGICILDEHKKLVYLNKAHCLMHGIPLSEKQTYIGRNWQELYNSKGQSYIDENVYPLLERDGVWRGETRIMRKDGKIIDADITLTMLPDKKGMIGTVRDISDRRQAEEKNKELQGQVHQAQKMEAIGRLAGGMAHDFNNILAAIMGYAEFLSEDLSEQKKLKLFADNILMAGRKGRTLIDQMLSFSRRKESLKSVVDMKELMAEMLSMLTASLPKTIELDVDYCYEKVAPVYGDPSQIAQALMNILVNAVDAMEDEKGALSVSLNLIEPDDECFDGMMSDELWPLEDMPPVNIHEIEPGHINLEMGCLKRGTKYFQISISDSGTGMTREIMEHIFEPFFTTKEVDKGTGLGMANVHGAIVSHQAAMIIDSVLMEGTTFDLFFPQTDHVDDLSFISNQTTKEVKKDFSGIRVLLVDDQPEVLSMMETLLEREHIECVAYQDSLEALADLRENPIKYDLVITDQNMPKMTGLELIDQTLQVNDELPFIIISGYSHEKLQEIRSSYPSIRACLQKPAKKEDLLKAISHVVLKTHF